MIDKLQMICKKQPTFQNMRFFYAAKKSVILLVFMGMF